MLTSDDGLELLKCLADTSHGHEPTAGAVSRDSNVQLSYVGYTIHLSAFVFAKGNKPDDEEDHNPTADMVSRDPHVRISLLYKSLIRFFSLRSIT